MSRQYDLGPQRFKILNCALELSYIGVCQVETTNNAMQRGTGHKLLSFQNGVDDACVSATRDYYESLAYNGLADVLKP